MRIKIEKNDFNKILDIYDIEVDLEAKVAVFSTKKIEKVAQIATGNKTDSTLTFEYEYDEVDLNEVRLTVYVTPDETIVYEKIEE